MGRKKSVMEFSEHCPCGCSLSSLSQEPNDTFPAELVRVVAIRLPLRVRVAEKRPLRPVVGRIRELDLPDLKRRAVAVVDHGVGHLLRRSGGAARAGLVDKV